MRRRKAVDCVDATRSRSKPVETDDTSVLDSAAAATSLAVVVATAITAADAAATARAGETSGHSTAAASRCGVV